MDSRNEKIHEKQTGFQNSQLMKTKPEIYSQEIVDKICELVSTDEYTNVELCKNAGISERTFYSWKAEKAEFAEKLAKADQKRLEFFKVEARKAALKKLQGYDYEETHTTFVDGGLDENGHSKPKIKEKKIVKRHVAPSDTQIMYVLNNTDSDNFAYKEKHEQTGDITVTVIREKLPSINER